MMFPAAIARHISSPAMHLIHHSIDPRHYDTNLAQIFTFWDRVAGTLYLPKEDEAITFGLGAESRFPARSVLGLYLAPFRGVAQRLWQRDAEPRTQAEVPRS